MASSQAPHAAAPRERCLGCGEQGCGVGWREVGACRVPAQQAFLLPAHRRGRLYATSQRIHGPRNKAAGGRAQQRCAGAQVGSVILPALGRTCCSSYRCRHCSYSCASISWNILRTLSVRLQVRGTGGGLVGESAGRRVGVGGRKQAAESACAGRLHWVPLPSRLSGLQSRAACPAARPSPESHPTHTYPTAWRPTCTEPTHPPTHAPTLPTHHPLRTRWAHPQKHTPVHRRVPVVGRVLLQRAQHQRQHGGAVGRHQLHNVLVVPQEQGPLRHL